MTSSCDSSSPIKSLHSFTQNPDTSECDQTIQDETIRVVDATTKEGGSNAEDGKKEGSDENIVNEPSKVLDTGECSGVGKTMVKKDEEEKSVVGEKRKFIPIDYLFIDLRQHQEEGGNENKRLKLDEESSTEAELRGIDQKGLIYQAKSEIDYKSIVQELEGGEVCENIKVEEGSPNEVAGPQEFDLNKKMEDEQDTSEENANREVEEGVVEEGEKEIKMEVPHSEDKNEANPSDEEEKNKEVMVSATSEVETALKYGGEPAEATLIEQQNYDNDGIVRDIDLNQLPSEYEEDN